VIYAKTQRSVFTCSKNIVYILGKIIDAKTQHGVFTLQKEFMHHIDLL